MSATRLALPILLGMAAGWLLAILPPRVTRWLRRRLGPPMAYAWTSGMGYSYWRAAVSDDLRWG